MYIKSSDGQIIKGMPLIDRGPHPIQSHFMTVEAVVGRAKPEELDDHSLNFEEMFIVDFDDFMVDNNPIIRKDLFKNIV